MRAFRTPSQDTTGMPVFQAWLLVMLGVCLVAACGRQESARPLTIGINSWPGYEFARLAREKGYYEAEGVDVKLVEFSNLTDVRRAFERGQLDGMFSTVVEVLQARQHDGRRPVIALVADYSNGADVVLALPHVPDLGSLRGRRVGLELGSLNTYLLARALDRAGLGLQDVTLVNLSQNELAAALSSRDVEAVVTYPPDLGRLEKSHGMKRLFTSAEIPGEILDVLSFDAQVLESRRDAVKAVLRAYAKAQRFAETDRLEARRVMAAQEGVSVEEFESALESGMSVVGADEQSAFFSVQGPLRKAVQRSSEVLLSTRQLERPVQAADVVPPGPVL